MIRRCALLVTDLVDSTRLTAELGEVESAALWARHDRRARDLLRAHGGREIDKTDGFLLLFDDADAAARYAVAYHRSLAELGLAARAGLHVGDVVLTENRPEDVALGAKPLEVDGLAKPVAARVMSAATGGQTLATAEAAAAVDATIRRVSHGHWRMKGVDDPVELVELGDDAAPFTPPPDSEKVYRVVRRDGLWLPVREVPRRLPAERDAFVGREADLRALAQLVEASRLVSVLGIGGTGKTRVATRFAWTWLGDWPGGAWFCDLAEARSVEGIAQAVAAAFDVPLGGGDPVAQLGNVLAARGRCLVLLDNFEQVARLAPATLGIWLDRAPDARFVTTTREVLGLPGEAALALAPLNVEESVDLFVTRARLANRAFEPTDGASIRALVQLLDGLPLAIELAAARVRIMPPHTLLQRMSERFRLLASTGGRTGRQATLRAAIDWSWELLSADEQRALTQLAVFEGGFTLEAAEEVLALEEAWPADAVQGLVDKSLVRRDGEDRFGLLVSVKEYALEKAMDREGAERRHGAWFAARGVVAGVDFRTLTADFDNLVAAVRRAVARSDARVAIGALRGVGAVVDMRGPVSVARELSERVLELPLSPADRARALLLYAAAARWVGEPAVSLARYEQAAGLAREAGKTRLLAAALRSAGSVLFDLGRLDEALDRFDEALPLAIACGDRVLEGLILGNQGVVVRARGRAADAEVAFERALATLRPTGHLRSEGNILYNLGVMQSAQGRIAEARATWDAALRVLRAAGDRRFEASVLTGYSRLFLEGGDLEGCIACLEQAITIYREVGDQRWEGVARGNLADHLVDVGRREEARAGFEAALAAHRRDGFTYGQPYWLIGLARLESEDGVDTWEAKADEAVAVAAPFPAVEAMARVARAGLLVDHQRTVEARADLEAARALGQPGEQALVLAQVEVRACLAEGRVDAARAALDEVWERARALFTSPSHLGWDAVRALDVRVRAAEGGAHPEA